MSESEGHNLETILIIGIILILIYIFIGLLFEKLKFHYIHETGFGIILGFIIGLIVCYQYADLLKDLNLYKELFIIIILPPIIFAGGYNLKKRCFFQNFKYITIYGLFGTLINFFIVWGLTFAISKAGLVRNFYSYDKSVDLDTRSILLFSATICATDSVSALAMINPVKYPKLFSIIFGEGMVNDSVSIILYTAIFEMFGDPDKEQEDFNFVKALVIIGNFLKTASLSVLLGLAFGLFTTLLTKKVRALEHLPKLETAIIFFIGFLSYLISEISEQSGVITILVCGIVMSHYMMYNISEKAQVTTKVVFDTISQICEAVIYIFLGIACFQFNNNGTTSFNEAWSWSFILLEIAVCFVARFFSIIVLSWCYMGYYQLRKKSWRVNIYELSIIWFAGVIRGAIAFALILKVQPIKGDKENYTYIVQTTTYAIVVGTTIILGGIMPSFVNYVLKKMNETQGNIQENISLKQSLKYWDTTLQKDYKSGSQQKWKHIDEKIFKPFFIYNYNERKEQIKQDKLNNLEKEEKEIKAEQVVIEEIQEEKQ